MLLLAFSLADAAPDRDPPRGEGDRSRGREVYAMSCTTCHHADPAKPGALGPEVAGASQELLEARLLRGAYPPGYTPKRPTTTMPAMPELEPRIADLVAYLAVSGGR